ncbi:putative ERAD-associated E3 ubiquitin-protein ligase component HRD3B [Cocos nucifera]|uniref:Putative ERAD-associated E3 ubiquitin-protein ligase component HRD3B n=1 Tax=Cocos nucifera TaxID=13894 RepID=A0A8K0IHB3_COCNU|nr:putative ERAD-associated E3 ubiquitin-protein ligase component HRD3B [Cocos nucifera]
MISVASSCDPAAMDSVASDIKAVASTGHSNARCALAFLFDTGLARPHSRPKSHLYHHFAVIAGNMVSLHYRLRVRVRLP